MSQLLKKFALLTACAALALCFTLQPAQVQAAATLDPKGLGDNIIFPYWETDMTGRKTNISITSPLGVRNSGEQRNVISIIVRGAGNETLRQFRICLMPGNSWTAAIQYKSDGMSSLMVVDPGSCDADVITPDADRSVWPTPMPDEMHSIEGMMGSIIAYTDPDDTLVDGPDADLNPEDARPRRITGTAQLINPTDGFSSAYQAVALVGDSAETQSATIGCGASALALGTDAADVNGLVFGMCLDAQIEAALLTHGNTVLVGLWSGLDDENVTARTKIVLTFPTMSNVAPTNFYVGGAGANQATIEKGTPDPLSLYMFNRMGQAVFVSHAVKLDKAVNVCTIDTMDDAVSCNGMDIEDTEPSATRQLQEFSGEEGSFRIFNNDPMVSNADDPANNDEGNEAGADTGGNFTLTEQAAPNALNAIGLVMTIYEGSDEKLYDETSTLQSTVDVDADAEPPVTDGSQGTDQL